MGKIVTCVVVVKTFNGSQMRKCVWYIVWCLVCHRYLEYHDCNKAQEDERSLQMPCSGALSVGFTVMQSHVIPHTTEFYYMKNLAIQPRLT